MLGADEEDKLALEAIKGVRRIIVVSGEDCRKPVRDSFCDKIEKCLTGDGLLLESKEDGETVRIFSSSNKNGDITEMLLTTKDEDESTFICFTGLMSREDLEKLIADAGKER